VYDAVERFGSSIVAFVIEIEKPKKKILKTCGNNSMAKVWKHFGKK
jgi:hypothetical protein